MSIDNASVSLASTFEGTLANAQREIAQLKGRIAEHERRAALGLEKREGDETHTASPFIFSEERTAVAVTREALIRLESARTVANARNTIVFEGRKMPLTEAIYRLAELRATLKWTKDLRIVEQKSYRNVQTGENDEYGHPKYTQKLMSISSHLSEKDRTAEVDGLQRRIDELNRALETANGRVRIKAELYV